MFIVSLSKLNFHYILLAINYSNGMLKKYFNLRIVCVLTSIHHVLKL